MTTVTKSTPAATAFAVLITGGEHKGCYLDAAGSIWEKKPKDIDIVSRRGFLPFATKLAAMAMKAEIAADEQSGATVRVVQLKARAA